MPVKRSLLENNPTASTPAKRRIAAWSFLAVSVLGTSTGCVISTGTEGGLPVDDTAVLARKPTAQESDIVKALRSSKILKRKFRIDCTPSLPSSTDGSSYATYGAVNANWHSLPMPVIHIAKSLCNNISAFEQHRNSNLFAHHAAQAMYAVDHEAHHISLDSGNEARVSCAGLQTVTTLAKAFGANATQRSIIFKDTVNVYDHQPANYQSPQCHDGGRYDLDPQHKGIYFPAQ
jgi:hypothetical protein